jgi:hypothetical protein
MSRAAVEFDELWGVGRHVPGDAAGGLRTVAASDRRRQRTHAEVLHAAGFEVSLLHAAASRKVLGSASRSMIVVAALPREGPRFSATLFRRRSQVGSSRGTILRPAGSRLALRGRAILRRRQQFKGMYSFRLKEDGSVVDQNSCEDFPATWGTAVTTWPRDGDIESVYAALRRFGRATGRSEPTSRPPVAAARRSSGSGEAAQKELRCSHRSRRAGAFSVRTA